MSAEPLTRAHYLRLGATISVVGLVHGSAIGAWSRNGEQVLYSAMKTPLLLTLGACVCIPFFYVLHLALGLSEQFSRAMRGLVLSQAAVALCLLSSTPILLVFDLSNASYTNMKLINAGLFLLSSLGGQVVLLRHGQPLLRERPRSWVVQAAWLLIYWAVTIQLAWSLRPFVGTPGMEPTFFRADIGRNAFEEVYRLIRRW